MEASTSPTGAPTVTGSRPGLVPAPQKGRSQGLVGDVAVDLGYAEREVVEAAVLEAAATARPTGRVLVEGGIISEDQLARIMAARLGLPYVDLSEFPVDRSLAGLIPQDAARRYAAVPVGQEADGRLLVAMADPSDVLALDDLRLLTEHAIQPAAASPEGMRQLVASLGRLDDAVNAAAEEAAREAPAPAEVFAAMDPDAPMVQLVESLIAQAARSAASDIHLDATDDGMDVSFRIDGVLGSVAQLPAEVAAAAVSRVKVMCELDISEKRSPQEGRTTVIVDSRPIDLRVVTLPLVTGESLTLRLLVRGADTKGLDQLGLDERDYTRVHSAIYGSQGGVFVTGPTGSGKTTTLYAALKLLAQDSRSIVTIEDPVEYRLEGIRQMPVNPRHGVTFPRGLQTLMRADPDIVMVGEVRDAETASVSAEAALTGHLVLATLHTNDAPSAATRLVEMGVRPYVVASALRCIVAQRLVRTLCLHCKREVRLSPALLQDNGFAASEAVEAFEPVGCGRCIRSGYRGRRGVFEVMPVDEPIREAIAAGATADAIRRLASEAGMRPLRENGLAKVASGETSLAEVARATG
jgi:type IV pilus assembly protein PilB